MKKIRFFCCLVSASACALVGNVDQNTSYMLRKILKLRLEERLRQCIIRHAFERGCSDKDYPTERRKLNDLPECGELLDAIKEAAGPQKAGRLMNEYDDAIGRLNGLSPYLTPLEWCVFGGVAAVAGTVCVVGAVVVVPKVVVAVVASKVYSSTVLGVASYVAQKYVGDLMANPNPQTIKEELERQKKIKSRHSKLYWELFDERWKKIHQQKCS